MICDNKFKSNLIVPFSNRIIATLIDIIIIVVISYFIQIIFWDLLIHLGSLKKLVGIGVFCSYFGIMDSYLCKGQTVGKMLLKIELMGKKGEYISLKKSFFRNIIFLSNFIIFFDISYISFIINILFESSMISFYFFNKRNKQLLHDFICQTYIVYMSSKKVKLNNFKTSKNLLVYSLIIFIFIFGFLNFLQLDDFFFIVNKVNELDKITVISKKWSIGKGTRNSDEYTDVYLWVNCIMDIESKNQLEKLQNDIAKKIIDSYYLKNKINKGYLGFVLYEKACDLGTSFIWEKKHFISLPISKWQQRLNGSGKIESKK
ncbi:RDD family protein [Orenia marismortui]|uniref:RDD family protein n=1 Tax=Orenia marismortui TaxID=46469 RepID=UPI000376649F|nr:RDD family protein [Orenia marismortui]